MELAIETVALTKRYGSLTAVNKLDLRVERNTIHGFLGPNGAGKSTTIKVLVGLLTPDEGTVKVLGEEVHGDKPDVRLRMGCMHALTFSFSLSISLVHSLCYVHHAVHRTQKNY